MPLMLNSDSDIGWHLKFGEYILSTGQIPTHELFSYPLTGASITPHEWLSQIAFALMYRMAGLNGVAWLTALVIAATCAVVTETLRRNGVRALIAGAAGVIVWITSGIHQLTRPHLFTWLCFALFLLALETYRRNRNWRTLLPVPIFMILWVNLHGAFIMGWVLVGFYIVGAVLEKNRLQVIELSVLGIVVFFASWINPVGQGFVEHSLIFLQSRFFVDTTAEYLSPNFHNISAYPFAGLILLSLAVAWRSPRQLAWTSLIVLAGWTAFGLYSARNIPLYAIAAACLVAPVVDTWIGEQTPWLSRFLSQSDKVDRIAWGWMWAAILVVLMIGLQASGVKTDVRNQGNVFSPDAFPIAAIDSFKGVPPDGNMFNEFTWGGYLVYRLFPQKQVFIDGQIDYHAESLAREYLQIINGEPGWEAKLDAHNVRWVIIPPTRPLAAWLNQSPNWSRTYQDDTAGVWIKNQGK